MSDDFLHRDVPVLGKRVFRVGLAGNYGIDSDGVRWALDQGIEYIYYTLRSGEMRAPVRDALQQHRDRIVLATGPTVGWFAGSVRRATERALRAFGVETLDVLMLGWVGVGAALTDGHLREIEELKRAGKVRTLGISIHDRERAGRLAADSAVDLFMIRYNAAHPGAERDIFPHLAARHPGLVAYTATSWRKLLRAPRGWGGPVMTAGDCYRFCLSRPEVDVVLTGPASRAQLEENLTSLRRGPLTPDEDAWMREFGRAVHG